MSLITSQSNSPSISGKKRYACFPIKIGALLAHRLTENLTLESGRLLKAGQTVHLDVQDITRHPHLAVKWVCRNPDCQGKHWDSKKSLVASHPDNRALDKEEQVHAYYGVATVPGIEARAQKLAKDGTVEQEQIDAKKPTVMLLSDEE